MAKPTNAEIAERQRYTNILRERLAPNTVIYTKVNHVSKSGMQRGISLYVAEGNEIRDITCHAAWAMGDTIHKQGGIKISGCGMDMGFALVYNLGRTLWPDGTPEPHGKRNGQPDSWGGYALKHRWL